MVKKNQHLSIQKYWTLGLALNHAKKIFPTFARSFTTCLLTFARMDKIWSTIFTWASRYNQNLACRLFRVYSLHMHEPSHQSTQPYKLFHAIIIIIKLRKRGNKSTAVWMLQKRKKAILNHNYLKRRKNRHRWEAAPHIHQQMPKLTSTQLLILDMISVIYVIIIRSSFLGKRWCIILPTITLSFYF